MQTEASQKPMGELIVVCSLAVVTQVKKDLLIQKLDYTRIK